MILFRYILSRVVTVFLLAFVAVLALIALMDAIELLRKSGGRDGVMGSIIAMALLHAPSVAMKALPFVMLLSGMWAYILLARSSEFVAARSAGHSFWSQAWAGMVAAFLIGVVAVGLYAPLSAAALNAYERMEAEIFDGGGSFLSVSGEGLWLRESVGDGHAVMRAARTNPEGTELIDATYFRFSKGDELRERVDAARATLEPGAWRLSDVSVYSLEYGADAAPPATEELESYVVPTRLTAEEIQNSFAPPETISVWRLPSVIAGMEEAGFSARRHIVHFHSMLALPIFLAAMTLIAAAFAIRPPRSAKFGSIALGCALSGFAFYFLSDVTQALGASGAAPPELGAWAPAFGAALLGVAFALVFGEA